MNYHYIGALATTRRARRKKGSCPVDSDKEHNDGQDEGFSVDNTSSESDPGIDGGWQDLCAVSIDAYGSGVPYEIRCERAESVLALELRQRQIPKSLEERRQLACCWM